MIWPIVKKELSANLVSFRFVLIFLLCCTLILISAVTTRDKYENRLKEYSAAVAQHKTELETAEGGAGLNQAAVNGYKLDKPPTPLSTIVEGMEGAAGNYSTVNILSAPTLEGGSGGDPMFAYFGTLDIMYIVRVVLSLVAILLTYDAISGEREQGTLKLALSNSVPRANVLLAKCIGGYITLLLPFMIPVLIALLILTTSGSINFSGQDWARLGLILLGSLLYIGIFLMLGLMVSSRSNRSTTSLMMLLFIWVVIVLATPKISMITAAKLRKVPSAQEIQADKDSAMSQLMAEGQRQTQEYVQAHREEFGDEAKRAKAMEEISKIQKDMFTEINRKKGQIDVEYEAKKANQFLLATRISRISPASVFTYASTTLARTGFNRQQKFLTAARAYQVGFVDYFNELMGRMIQEREEGDTLKFELDKLPTLDFQEASLSDSWNSAMIDFLILFLILTCFFMIAYVGFIRSDIR